MSEITEPIGRGEFNPMDYVWQPSRFLEAQSAALLVDGKSAYPDMLGAIGSAGRSVDLETYIIRADRTGGLFHDALCRAARRGVAVRLIYDYVGSLHLPAGFIHELAAAGVRTAVYNPPIFRWWLGAFNNRDHRKLLIVDGATVFTGGLNIADEYADKAVGGKGWRDTHVRIESRPVASAAATAFEYAWRRAVENPQAASRASRIRAAIRGRLRNVLGALAGPRPVEALAAAPPGLPVQFISNHRRSHRKAIRMAYLLAIRRARKYIMIENAYFIPDRGVRRALVNAVRRGVSVSVAVARQSDSTIAACASRAIYGELLSAGVRVYEWSDGMLHAKTAVIDDAWAIVGSFNFDRRSMVHQLEAVAVVSDRTFAQALAAQTAADIARCREVTHAQHKARPWLIKFLEHLAYLFRNLL
ncbi:MAG: cardiolipin synthase ClsB [Planctomycetes bacterium]|nr:cardiolipin synthase ClsB [Planctomycetota bacterium]